MASLDYILVNSDVCVLKGLNGLKIVDSRNSQSMIGLKNVKKAYVSKTKRTSLALNDVSFVLPDKGFVYALGKSGSGKSTLLNLLGSLDSVSEGDISIDGKPLKDFTKEEIDYYRSVYCGFIFQDYKLINELTAKDNIILPLDIKNDSIDCEAGKFKQGEEKESF